MIKLRRAAILTLFVLLLPVLLIMLGFSIDVAYMQMVQTEMRLASDNIARVTADNLCRTENQSKAIAEAIEVAKQFTVAGKPLELKEDDIDFGRATRNKAGDYSFDSAGYPPNAVQINAVRDDSRQDGAVPLFFSQLIGYGNYSPKVTATAAFNNVDICLVLDRSTSMKLPLDSTESGLSINDPRFCSPPNGQSRWRGLDSGVKVFVDVLKDNTVDEQIAIVTYGTDLNQIMRGLCGRLLTATVDLELNTNLNNVTGKINSLTSAVWNGNTNIAAGIDKGVEELTSSRGRKYADRVMIVLTDGYPTEGDAIASAQKALEKNIKVYTITFGDDADQAYMSRVAAAGNGEHAHADSSATLEEVFRQFAAKAVILVQ